MAWAGTRLALSGFGLEFPSLLASVPVIGISESDSETKFAFQTGGGFTILLTENVGIRTAVDYRRIVLGEDEGDDDSEVRGIAGIVFGWGAR